MYISFSGGKDSTVLLHLVRNVFPDVVAVFVDTGLEYPELKQFVRTIPNVVTLRPEMNFKEVITKYGYPIISKDVANKVAGAKPGNTRWQQLHGEYVNPKTGQLSSMYNYKRWEYLLDADFKISDKCCTIMKKRPSEKYEKETGLHPYLGLMACESVKRRNDYLKTGCNAFSKKRSQSQPMGFWTDQDVLKYLHDYNIPYASPYGEIRQDKNGKYYTTGCRRSGCLFCGLGCQTEKEPNRFQQLKQTHPKLWEYCMKPLEENGLGLQKVLDYINVKTE